MFSFYKRLADIEKRPLVYFANLSISELWSFILGYRLGITDIDLTLHTEDLEDFGYFNNWVRNYYGFVASTSGWRIMILENSVNEEQAFYTFFDLLHRFLDGERPPNNPVAISDTTDDWVDVYLAKRAARQKDITSE